MTTMFESTFSIMAQSTLTTINSLFSTTKTLNKSTVILSTETKPEASTAPITIPGTISTKNIQSTSTVKSSILSTARLQSKYKTETPTILTTKSLYSSEAMFQTSSTVKVPFTSVAITSSVSTIETSKISSVILSTKSKHEMPLSTTKVRPTTTASTSFPSTIRAPTSYQNQKCR